MSSHSTANFMNYAGNSICHKGYVGQQTPLSAWDLLTSFTQEELLNFKTRSPGIHWFSTRNKLFQEIQSVPLFVWDIHMCQWTSSIVATSHHWALKYLELQVTVCRNKTLHHQEITMLPIQCPMYCNFNHSIDIPLLKWGCREVSL